jgi:hypothetical protein
VEVPKQFDADTEFGLTEMQTAFVWHYSQGGCGQTEAARKRLLFLCGPPSRVKSVFPRILPKTLINQRLAS